jgi:hypothetical protein
MSNNRRTQSSHSITRGKVSFPDQKNWSGQKNFALPFGEDGSKSGSSISGDFPPQTPYLLPVGKVSARAQTSHRIVDKSSIIWRDFLAGVNRRKKLIHRLRDISLNDASTAPMLKRMLLELRQMSLRIIEDALEIEYRSQFDKGKSQVGFSNSSSMQLPPIHSNRGMEEKEDQLALCDMINDVDELFKIPVIRVFLPMEFPTFRNPFLLGKGVDQLANLVPPQPEPGNLEEELKVLELLRYKRASKALLKAELMVTNKMPISLQDVEKLWYRMDNDPNLESLIRCICAFLDNDKPNFGQEPIMKALLGLVLKIEAHEFLGRLNRFKGDSPMRIDVQAAVRTQLRGCSFVHLDDAASVFLIEWVNAVLSATANQPSIAGSTQTINPNEGVGLFHVGKGRSSNSTIGGAGSYYGTASVRGGVNGGPYMDSSMLGGDSQTLRTSSYAQNNHNSYRLGGEGGNENVSIVTSEDIHGRSSYDDGLESPTKIHKIQPVNRNASQVSLASLQDRGPSVAASALLGKAPISKSKKSKGGGGGVSARDIRQEIERIMMEKGLSNNNNNNVRVKNSDDDNGNGNESETVQSLRYELGRMQTELLRRNVLDPKHYKAMSVDAVSQNNQGLTIQDKQAPKAKKVKRQIPVAVIPNTPLLGPPDDEQGSIDFYLDIASDSLVAKIYRFELPEKGEFDDLSLDTNGSLIQSKNVKELIGTTWCSKLLFNRLTTSKLDKMMEEELPSDRLKIMYVIVDQLLKTAATTKLKGRFNLIADRVLFNNTIRGEGVAAELCISRNEVCTGFTIRVTPFSNTGNVEGNGPITLQLQDTELQVLLINQRGLYILGQIKWQTMETISQWIASRVRLRRVNVVAKGVEPLVIDPSRPTTADQLALQNGERPLTADITSEMKRKKKSPALLDVSIDRRVELARVTLQQWRSRNVPNIKGMKLKLTAFQDIEMLRIEIVLTIPHPLSKKKRKATRKSKKETLIDYSQYEDDSDGDYDSEDETPEETALREEEEKNKRANIKETIYEPFVIRLTYRLTQSELSIFGTADLMGTQKIALPSKGKGMEYNNPASYMWNIMARLFIKFKGNALDPYSEDCHADTQEHWSISYDRRLVRDVRNISGGVLVVTIQAIGNELLYEVQPTDKAVYSEVGSKIVEASEISEMAYTEGWPISILEYPQRSQLAYRILEQLKVINDKGAHRLETNSFPESRLLNVVVEGQRGRGEMKLGSVEINNHHSLVDLRAIMRNELERDSIPKQFRFYYKGTVCAVRQESFRRAWELLPKCVILSKVQVKEDDDGNAIAVKKTPQQEERERKEAARKRKEDSRVEAGSRRVKKKLTPVPLFSLCVVQENSKEIFILHDGRELLLPGDVIRIGNSESRDYVIDSRPRMLQNQYPKTVAIEPAYDLINEPDYEVPYTLNLRDPSQGVGKYLFQGEEHGEQVIPTWKDQGFDFQFPILENSDMDTVVTAAESKDGTLASSKKDDNETKEGSKDEGIDEEKELQLARARIKGPGGQLPIDANPVWTEVWMWKCIPPMEDKRPRWRRMYDNGLVKYSYNYVGDYDTGVKFFRTKALYSYMEVLCTDNRCPQFTRFSQRVNEMSLFSIDFYTQTAYDHILKWFQKNEKGVECTKFQKFIKELRAFPDYKKRTSEFDLLFEKEVSGANGVGKKYVNYAGFCSLIQELALIRYPSNFSNGGGGSDDISDALSVTSSLSGATQGTMVTKGSRKKFVDGEDTGMDVNEQAAVLAEHAASSYRKFVTEFVLCVPEWIGFVWNSAKVAAMDREGKLYCAATRIGAAMRGIMQSYNYRFFLECHIELQSFIRRKQAIKRVVKIRQRLMDDWLFRLRYHSASKISAVVRRYVTRCWLYRVMQKIKSQQVVMQKARRFRMRKKRVAEKKAIVYKETKRISNCMVLLTVWRKDPRNFSRDFGVIIALYIPQGQTTFKFLVEEADLRLYMMKELRVDALNAGDLMDKRNLQKVVSARIIIRQNKLGPPQVLFSKQALGQRGAKKVVIGKRLGKEHFVLTLFESGDDITVQAYHRVTSTMFKLSLQNHVLHNWVQEDQESRIKDPLLNQKMPEILKKGNKTKLYKWAMNGVVLDTRKGRFNVLFGCQYVKSRKMEMLIKLQAHFRRCLTKPRIIEILQNKLIKIKVHVSNNDECYYINKKTGESFWDKPRLLGGSDLRVQPKYEWVPLTYFSDGLLYQHYVNPWTGKFTYITVVKAASVIQAMVRAFILRQIMLPKDKLMKVGMICKGSKESFDANPNKLATVINLALTTHAVYHHETEGKELYLKAMELSESNPLVQRCFGLFLLCACEHPVVLVREKALNLLNDAKLRDKNNLKFATAYLFYILGALREPRNHQVLLNLAIIETLIYENIPRAERFFRRCLAIAPFDKRVISVWTFLQDRFPMTKKVFTTRSKVAINDNRKDRTRLIHGRPCLEDTAWAGWCFVEEDPFKKTTIVGEYWYNPASGEESLSEPMFKGEWKKRIQRSEFEKEEDGLMHYFDPLTQQYFQYHHMTDTYA